MALMEGMLNSDNQKQRVLACQKLTFIFNNNFEMTVSNSSRLDVLYDECQGALETLFELRFVPVWRNMPSERVLFDLDEGLVRLRDRRLTESFHEQWLAEGKCPWCGSPLKFLLRAAARNKLTGSNRPTMYCAICMKLADTEYGMALTAFDCHID